MEAVPNLSDGRDPALAERLVRAATDAGAEVLDWSSDADHNRTVVTLVGEVAQVEAAALAVARIAAERIDMRHHRGVHPRIGALDVLPFVPLVGLTLDDARESAHRVGRRLAAEIGLPVFYYGAAADPPGRELSTLRRGGYEALVGAWPQDRKPDELPDGWPHPGAHPTAGAVCVGARRLLLAWNVEVAGVSLAVAKDIAATIRAAGGGFAGLRALALELPRRRAIQISMNLEDLERMSPLEVFRRIEGLAEERGGSVVETEVVGMIPDALILTAATDRLRLHGAGRERMLSHRLAAHLSNRVGGPDESKLA